MSRPIRLNVFLGDECVGHIDDLVPPAFRYAPAWLARKHPLALAAIPLSSEPQQAPEAAQYEPGSWSELATRLGRTTAAAIDLNGTGARISLAGAQDKASIALFDGKPYLPRGTAPSTHILKPDIRRLAKVWHSSANETLVMEIPAQCGLPAAEVLPSAVKPVLDRSVANTSSPWRVHSTCSRRSF